MKFLQWLLLVAGIAKSLRLLGHVQSSNFNSKENQ